MADLLPAFDFANSDGGSKAFLGRRTRKIYWRFSDLDEPDEELPDDIEESGNDISIPEKMILISARD